MDVVTTAAGWNAVAERESIAATTSITVIGELLLLLLLLLKASFMLTAFDRDDFLHLFLICSDCEPVRLLELFV